MNYAGVRYTADGHHVVILMLQMIEFFRYFFPFNVFTLISVNKHV